MASAIQLRRYRSDDVDAVCSAVLESIAELSTWLPWCGPDYSRSDAEAWVESRPGAWERNEEKSFLAVDSGDRILGTCGIHHIDVLNGRAELGYWVRSSATRRGVATAAVRQACIWAFGETDLHRIEIIVSVENLASRRVAEKAGGTCEGVLRERILLNGRRHDCVLYSILNSQR